MKLSEQDAELFFDLTRTLHLYVNERFSINPKIKNIDDLMESSDQERFEIRRQLYEHIEIIDDFLKENSGRLDKEKVSILLSWKNFVQGDFQIERLLKKYAVFIKEGEVYGVLGIALSFDEMVHPSNLPMYVKTTLLPFKGRIIFDGMFQTYRIHFGGGIKRRLKEEYMTAKQNNRIIESLEPVKKEKQPAAKIKAINTYESELASLAATAKKLRGGSNQPAINSPAFSLVRASIEFAQLATDDPNDVEGLYNLLNKVQKIFKKNFTVLNRSI